VIIAVWLAFLDVIRILLPFPMRRPDRRIGVLRPA
jgi:hypothetical protein